MSQQHQKPVQLQLNNSGAWKTVVKFDAADQPTSDKVVEAAVALSAIDMSTRFRVATHDGLQQVLLYIDKGEWRHA
jgi:hypothetical protein